MWHGHHPQSGAKRHDAKGNRSLSAVTAPGFVCWLRPRVVGSDPLSLRSQSSVQGLPIAIVTDTFACVSSPNFLFGFRSRVLRLCRSRGLLGEEGELDVSELTEEQGLPLLLCAASIQGRAELGSEPGATIERLGVPTSCLPGRGVVMKELCADLDGLLL
jgi:hypothetical protein